MKQRFTNFKQVQFKLYKTLFAITVFLLSSYEQINAQCSCTGSSGNLLTNGSFETSGGSSSTSGWSSSNAGFSSVSGNGSSSFPAFQVCGNWYGLLIPNQPGSGTSTGLFYQEITGSTATATVGKLLTFNIWAGTYADAAGNSPTLKLIFYNSSGTEITGSTVTVPVDRNNISSTVGLKLFTLTQTAPAGTSKIRVQGSMTRASSQSSDRYLKVDGACLSYNNLTLGNKVFYDKNNNGIFDATEHGMDGFTVNLYADANDDNVADGAAIKTTTTAGGGTYTFTNLSAGNYIVGVVNTVTDLASSTGGSTNPDDNTDNDDNGIAVVGTEIRSNAITLTPGSEPTTDGDGNNGNLTLDFGLRCTSTANGCGNVLLGQGNYIWKDINGNGLKDVNEPGVANVSVKLYKDVNGDNVPDFTGGGNADGSGGIENLTAIQSTTTNAQGVYSFNSNVAEGRYILGITLPAGYVRVIAASANPDNDIDNDNNGVNQVGSDVFSNAVTLNYYMEPGVAIDNDNTNVNSTVDFAITQTGGPQALSFTALEGINKKGISYLTWATLQESNSSHFDVERSTDGFSYSVIGKVNAQGNSGSKFNYSFNDAKASVGANFYRLRMIDKDGSYSYSNVVKLTVKLSGTIVANLYPNPFINKIEAVINSDKNTNVTVSLFDFSGKLVVNQQQLIKSGSSILVIDKLDNLAKGYYMLKIQTDDFVVTQKLMK